MAYTLLFLGDGLAAALLPSRFVRAADVLLHSLCHCGDATGVALVHAVGYCVAPGRSVRVHIPGAERRPGGASGVTAGPPRVAGGPGPARTPHADRAPHYTSIRPLLRAPINRQLLRWAVQEASWWTNPALKKKSGGCKSYEKRGNTTRGIPRSADLNRPPRPRSHSAHPRPGCTGSAGGMRGERCQQKETKREEHATAESASNTRIQTHPQSSCTGASPLASHRR